MINKLPRDFDKYGFAKKLLNASIIFLGLSLLVDTIEHPITNIVSWLLAIVGLFFFGMLVMLCFTE